MNEFDESRYFSDETNFNCWKQLSELAIEELKKYYTPKNYENNQYVPVTEFDSFINGTSPFSVFDIIEAYAYLLENINAFKERVNILFSFHHLDFKSTSEGKIITNQEILFRLDPKKPVKEAGLEALLLTSEKEYSKGNYSDAVGKLWDAFERIKTYYYPTLDKKRSAEKIIDELSFGNKAIIKIFETGFKTLTDIGNLFCIRHHEKIK